MTKGHVRVIYKPNVFEHLDVVWRFGLEVHQETTGFIMYFIYQPFWMLPNTVLLTVSVFRKDTERIQPLLETPMLFNFGAFPQK